MECKACLAKEGRRVRFSMARLHAKVYTTNQDLTVGVFPFSQLTDIIVPIRNTKGYLLCVVRTNS